MGNPSTITIPAPRTALDDVDDDVCHFVCCDQTRAMCGADLSNSPFCHNPGPCDDACPLCEFAAESPCLRCGGGL